MSSCCLKFFTLFFVSVVVQELSKASKVEMNLLAQLVNVQRAPHDNFTLQLFQESRYFVAHISRLFVLHNAFNVFDLLLQ
jgi:hypothetical protein